MAYRLLSEGEKIQAVMKCLWMMPKLGRVCLLAKVNQLVKLGVLVLSGIAEQ